MTLSQALEVKEILMQCQGTIPATHVDRIYHYHKSYIDPNAVKPCTCTSGPWNQMLMSLKNKVEETLNGTQVL